MPRRTSRPPRPTTRRSSTNRFANPSVGNMSRKRTGALVPPDVEGIWRARVTKTHADGSTTRPLYSLGTTDKALARRKLARLVALVEAGADVLDAAETANAPERVKEYAEAWLKKREAQGIA